MPKKSIDGRKADAVKNPHQVVDWEAVLARIPGGNTVVHYKAGRKVFRQGDPADSLFYVREGKIKLSVISGGG